MLEAAVMLQTARPDEFIEGLESFDEIIDLAMLNEIKGEEYQAALERQRAAGGGTPGKPPEEYT